jgi:hypothetical protein
MHPQTVFDFFVNIQKGTLLFQLTFFFGLQKRQNNLLNDNKTRFPSHNLKFKSEKKKIEVLKKSYNFEIAPTKVG